MTGLPMPDAPRVLALVQAGGQGARMDVLTRERAKPALPFAGSYQLIDIALSNIANSGVDDVWVSVQYMAGSLDAHLQSGRPWDLDRDRGGYRRLVPEEGRDRDGFSSGNADDLAKIAPQIEALAPDVVVVLSADQVCSIDLRALVHGHLAAGRTATLTTTEVSRQMAAHKAVVTADATGRVTRIEEKPSRPEHGTISAEIVAVETTALLAALQEVRRQRQEASAAGGDPGLGDLAEHLLPHLVETGEVGTHRLTGYWRDMGRPALFLGAHRDLCHGRVDTFDQPGWPIRSSQPDLPPARIREGAQVADSVIAAGCDVAGAVRGSTLGPGTVVRAGATVEDSVLFAGVVVEADARVSTSLVDDAVVIGRGAIVGELSLGRVSDERVTLVGRDSRVGAGQRVEAGGRLEPGTTL